VFYPSPLQHLLRRRRGRAATRPDRGRSPVSLNDRIGSPVLRYLVERDVRPVRAPWEGVRRAPGTVEVRGPPQRDAARPGLVPGEVPRRPGIRPGSSEDRGRGPRLVPRDVDDSAAASGAPRRVLRGCGPVEVHAPGSNHLDRVVLPHRTSLQNASPVTPDVEVSAESW